jgi:hypothetical protein
MSAEDIEVAKRLARKLLIETGDHMAKWLIQHSLYEMELFFNSIETLIEKEEKRQLSDLEEFLKTVSEDERREVLSKHYPFEWKQIIGAHFRSSFLITLMSITEDSLSMICTQISTMVDSQISHKDLKGSILEGSKKFLQTIGHFSTPSDDDWTTIFDLYKVRNMFVHNRGSLDDSTTAKRIQSFMKRAPGISNDSGFIKLRKDFCSYALEQVRQLFLHLEEEQELLRFNLKLKATGD